MSLADRPHVPSEVKAHQIPVQPEVIVSFGSSRSWQRLYVPVPSLLEPSDPGDAQRLTWRTSSRARLVDVGWFLDAFVFLADAEFSAVRDFAARFGPLGRWKEGQALSTGDSTVSESIALWSALARSLRASLAVASDLVAERRVDGQQWIEALTAPRAAQAIHSGDAQWEPGSTLFHAILDGVPIFHAEQVSHVRAIANDLLAAAGVRADSGFGEQGSLGPSFVVPLRSRNKDFDEAGRPYQVNEGLLPILALQTVEAMHDNRIYFCDACHLPIPLRPGEKRPRSDQSFYGNHETCRREAMLRSKRDSQKRRYRRMRDAKAAGTISADDQTVQDKS